MINTNIPNPLYPGRVVIIGAGPTGLGAARRLLELGHKDVKMYDKAPLPGGLSRSIVDSRGFTWDLGGHVQFSHYAYYDAVLDEVLKDQWLWHDRESWVWIKRRFVPYPYQNNIHRLGPADCERSFEDMKSARSLRSTLTDRPKDFADWMQRTFGTKICEDFLRPYNFKVWAYPPERMSADWMGERVAVPDLERISRNIAARQDDVSWGPNNKFRFPLRGGTGALWSAVANKLPVDVLTTGTAVVEVRLNARAVVLDSGEVVPYDTLISTIPLDLLAERCVGLSHASKSAAGKLLYSSTHVIGVGLRGDTPKHLSTKCWMYFPESNSPYYRVTVFSNYSPYHVPDVNHWSLMAEVSESPQKPICDDVVASTVEAMRDDGLIDNTSEVVSLWHQRLDHGYPTPSVDRDRLLDVIQPELEAARVFSRGRFGGWKYEVANQDHSFMQGVELADFLADGLQETTYRDPNTANSGVFLKK